MSRGPGVSKKPTFRVKFWILCFFDSKYAKMIKFRPLKHGWWSPGVRGFQQSRLFGLNSEFYGFLTQNMLRWSSPGHCNMVGEVPGSGGFNKADFLGWIVNFLVFWLKICWDDQVQAIETWLVKSRGPGVSTKPAFWVEFWILWFFYSKYAKMIKFRQLKHGWWSFGVRGFQQSQLFGLNSEFYGFFYSKYA